MNSPRYPTLFQVNTRVWLTSLGRSLGRAATLDDVPDEELDRWAAAGVDFVWLLSVWQTGLAAQRVSRSQPQWLEEFRQTLPDLSDDDVAGSGFAITGYTVHQNLGGDAALARLRQRLRQRGLRLMLDFVPNHLAPDHPWVEAHPDYFVAGTAADLERAPQNYLRLTGAGGDRIVAHGRDPYFPGWPDTVQLNYGNPAAQEALRGELRRMASQCDGLRCDMAMLVLPEVFQRTWNIACEPFWPRATAEVRGEHPDFCFLAEVYWDLEWTLQQQGFSYTYDKRMYDRLRAGKARPVRDHLLAGLDFQDKLARFLENHDEPRAAATFSPEMHRAAALVTFLTPGMRFFHQGQFEGNRVRISPHLIRGPQEPVDAPTTEFYRRLLAIVRRDEVRNGQWQLLECRPAWPGNASCQSVLAWQWRGSDGQRLIVAVNYAPHASQALISLPGDDLRAHDWRLADLLTGGHFDWQGESLATGGLFVELAGWGGHVLEFQDRGTS